MITQSTVQGKLQLHLQATAAEELRSHATLSLTTASSPLQHWIHPALTQSVHPNKGRQLLTSRPIQKGDPILIDNPYAIIPLPEPNSDILCSNPQCNRLVPRITGQSCPNRCIQEVNWCNSDCQRIDARRHEFECTWLARYSSPLRTKRGEYNFGMLWLIVRILATRHIETLHSRKSSDTDTDLPVDLPHPHFKAGWGAIQSLCGSTETWSHAEVREWTALTKKYLGSSSLPHGMAADDILNLICREEANSFGLYPRETGIWPLPDGAPVNRGEKFGGAVYPRASIANHSCCPNITHKPDESGRMVFTAAKDIAAGEECCISYFDMAQHITITDRRDHLQSLFRFKCGCGRCLEEEVPEQDEVQWDALPGFD